jgi:hypothetical protein
MKPNWLKRIIPRIGMLAVVLAVFIIPLFSALPVMGAANHWTNVNGGNWSDHGNWSLGHDPDATEDALFDCAFNAGKTVTVNAAASCLNMDWTGATNTPTLTLGSFPFYVYGNVTFITGMTVTKSGFGISWLANGNFTSAGKSLKYVAILGGSVLTLTDNITCGRFSNTQGTLVTNNFSINTDEQGFLLDGAGAKTLTLGSSVITTSDAVGWNYSGSNLTLTANTSTINVSGTGAFAGGAPTGSYGTINLNGSAHTVSGAFTCVTLNRNGTATTTDTITLTSGTNITATTFAMKGNSATNRLLVKSTVAGTSANVTATNWTGSQNINVKDIRAVNAVNLSAITGGALDYTGNTNITFTTPVFAIAAATNTGTNTPTLNVTITSVVAPTTGYFQYGLTSAYGSTTPSVTLTAGTHGVAITHPSYPRDIYYRFIAVSGLTTYNSSGTSLSPATAAKAFSLDQILQVVPLLIYALVILGSAALSIFGWKKGNILLVGVGLVFIAVAIILYPIIIAGIEGILAFIP